MENLLDNRSRMKLFVRAEESLEGVARTGRRVLPTLARFCLISTFLDDGIRMWVQWSGQQEYMQSSWNCGVAAAFLFVLVNLIVQLVGVGMILMRVKVDLATYMLFFVVLEQTIAYRLIHYLPFLFRNLALMSGLFLILAESRTETKSLMAGLPRLEEDNKARNYLQLAGRAMLPFMFLTLIKLSLSTSLVIQNIVGGILMALVTVGYKTKTSAMVLVTWLNFLNLYMHPWWTVPADSHTRDLWKFDFFQTLSVIGGLLMVIHLGPGHLSLDESKKKR
eukprot:TRINITY_DN14_c0_g1_i3.p1 TRINITY_DN14_c0_g1~~TRINITY_DN14_c0_g1_i3.p1  ORF type:complete len:278 (-),score=56.14 TRINITY_DN14_c0_g1_i3:223-1056(-)